jgi:hypothetical protein
LEIGSFGFAEGSALCVGAKPNVPMCGWLKEILKNAKGWLFLSFLSPVPKEKHGQFESLSAWSLGRYGLYVESIFSHCLAVSIVWISVFLALVVTVRGLTQWGIRSTNVQ